MEHHGWSKVGRILSLLKLTRYVCESIEMCFYGLREAVELGFETENGVLRGGGMI